MSVSRAKHRMISVLNVAATVACLAALWCVWDITIDDAYITFRYSQNLAFGHGPVWNPGETPVQGYTNFLWMLVLVPVAWLGLPLEVAAKILGALATLCIALQLSACVRQQQGPVWLERFLVLVWLLFLPTWIHTVAGLETQAYAFFVLKLCATAHAGFKPRQAAFWGLFCGLTRPEGFAVAAVAGAWMLCISGQRRQVFFAFLWILALPALALLGWQAWYYQSMLPNTFYVKVGNLAQGWLWLQSSAPLLLPAGGLALLHAWPNPRGPATLILLLLLVGSAPYTISSLLMDYSARFLCHLLPLCLWAAALGLQALPSKYGGPLASALGSGMACYGLFLVEPAELLYGRNLKAVHIALGKALASAETPAHSRTMALVDAGALPYYAGWQCLDLVGLNDRAIAHGVTPTDRVQEFKPTLIFLYTRQGRPVPSQFGISVAELGNYRFLARTSWSETFQLSAYIASQTSPEITKTLQAAIQSAPGNREPLSWQAWLRHLQNRSRRSYLGRLLHPS